MRILLTNDDGIRSPEIALLARTLSPNHEVLVVAPETEQSGVGHAFTYRRDLVVEAYSCDDFTGWSVHGTPADCVKYAVVALYHEQGPDLVISGINQGTNLGIAAIYSGTVAGAREAALWNVPGIALSVPENDPASLEASLKWLQEFVDQSWHQNIQTGSFWNVNFPVGGDYQLSDSQFGAMGLVMYEDEYIASKEIANGWTLKGVKSSENYTTNSDEWIQERGQVAITPHQLNTTDWDQLKKLNDKTTKLGSGDV